MSTLREAGEAERGPGAQPVGALAFGVEIAVPDQEAVADVKVLAPGREIEHVLAERVGEQGARAPAGVELLDVDAAVAVVGEAAGIAVAEGQRADARDQAIEGAGRLALEGRAERRLDIALAPLRIAGDLAAAQIEAAGAEIGVLGVEVAGADLDPGLDG